MRFMVHHRSWSERGIRQQLVLLRSVMQAVNRLIRCFPDELTNPPLSALSVKPLADIRPHRRTILRGR